MFPCAAEHMAWALKTQMTQRWSEQYFHTSSSWNKWPTVFNTILRLTPVLRPPALDSGGSSSDSEFVGLCQHHLEYGHKRWRLAEVAVTDYVGVDVEALRVGPTLDGPGYVV